MTTPATTLKHPNIFSVLTLVLVVLAGLFLYKWGGAYRTLARVESSGAYQAPAELIPTAGLPFLAVSGAKTINYLATVWPALLFGVLIAGLVRAFVSAKEVVRLLGSGGLRQQLVGGVVGMPLMLCSCCIAPVFTSVHAQGVRLAPSLAVMFGSPSLNVAALALTFLLFPHDMAWARVALAAFAVFVLPVLVERLARGPTPAPQVEGSACAAENLPDRPIHVLARWAAASGSVTAKTLPMIVLGVYASSLLVGLFARPAAPGAPTVLIIALVALFATLVALPTFLEIPFGMLLLANGFPAGAALAMLFAGPAINTPSLFTLARVSSRRIALLVFLGVWITATLGGVLFEFLAASAPRPA